VTALVWLGAQATAEPLTIHRPSSMNSAAVSATNQISAKQVSRRLRIRPGRDQAASPNTSARMARNGTAR